MLEAENQDKNGSKEVRMYTITINALKINME
jgi:hypothetical protein